MNAAHDISIFVAVGGGVLSFLSPCVLPLVPGYISYITGMNIDELSSHQGKKLFYIRVFLSSLFFVLGFSVLFVAMGAGASSISRFLVRHSKIFSMIAGAIIFIFGLHLAGILPIPFLLREKRVDFKQQGASFFTSFLIGFFFAFGWTPCVGPILASILAIAAQKENLFQGILLLSAYSAGLGIPFILSALFLNSFFTFFEGIKRHLRKIEIATGILLMGVGILMFFNKMTFISSLFSSIGFII